MLKIVYIVINLSANYISAIHCDYTSLMNRAVRLPFVLLTI